MYKYTCTHAYPPIHERAYIIHTHITHQHACIQTTHSQTLTWIHAYIHLCVCVCVCVCVCTRWCVRVCVYIKSGPQRSQYQRRHDGSTRGPSLSRGTTPSLRKARAGNGGSLRRGVHGRGDHATYCHSAKARLVSSGLARTQTSCCRRTLVKLTKGLVARLLSWWLLNTATHTHTHAKRTQPV